MINKLHCIDTLRSRITEHFSNKKNKVVISSSVEQINSSVYDKYIELNEKFRADEVKQEDVKKIANYLRKIDAECNVDDDEQEELFTISPNTLKNFLDTSKDPSNRVLHILCIYFGFYGWYDYVDDINRIENEKLFPNPVEKDINPVEDFSEFLKSCEENLFSKTDSALNFNSTINKNFKLQEELQRVMEFCSKSRSKLDSLIPPSAKEMSLRIDFNQIANAKEVSISHIDTINKILGDEGRQSGYKWYHRSMVASALTISFIRHYDELKTDYLIKLVIDNENELNSDVWQKALIGLIIGLLNNYKDEKRISRFTKKLGEIAQIDRVKESIRHIVLKLIYHDFEFCCNTSIKDSDFFTETYKCFIPFNIDSEILKDAFKKNPVNIDTDYFTKLLSGSEFVSNYDKYSMALNYSSLKKENAVRLFNMFKAESHNIKHSKRYNHALTQEKQFSKIINEFFLSLSTKEDLSDVFIYDLSNSITEQKEFIKVVSDIFNENLTSAVYAENEKDYSTAIKEYFRSATNGHETEWAWGKAGSIYYRIGYFKDAIHCYKKVEEINLNNIENLIKLGDCLLHSKNYDEGNDYFNRYANLFPEEWENIYLVAKRFSKAGYYQYALDYFLKVEQIERDNVEILKHIGYCFQELGDLKSAIEYYKNVEIIDPNNSWTMEHLGWCLLEMGEFNHALKYYEKAEKIEPNVIQHPYGAGRCLEKLGEFKQALKYSYKAEKIAPDNVWTLKQIGWCLQNQGYHVKAVKYYLKVNKIQPEDDWNKSQLSYCLAQIGKKKLEKGNFKLALNYFQKAEKIEPDNIWYSKQIRWCLQNLGEIKDAFEYYEKVEIVEPNNTWNLKLMGRCLQRQLSFNKAIEYYSRVEDIEPNDAWNLNQIGWCLQNLGDVENALQCHLRADEIEPNDVWTLKQIGLCFHKNGKYKKALEYYEKVEKIEPGDKLILEQIFFCKYVLKKT